MKIVGEQKARLLVETLPDIGVFVVTAFDEDQFEICTAAARTRSVAIAQCLRKLPDGYVVDIEDMNPEHDSEADCW